MREIKFKAYDTVDKCMYREITEIKFIERNSEPYKIFLAYGEQLTNPILMQYTGLKDKNGVEIYAGDILLITEYDGKTEKFVIENKYDWDRDGEGHWGICIGTDRPEHEAEVIGNIYQNPNLIK